MSRVDGASSRQNFRLGILNVHGFVNGQGEEAFEATVRLLRNAGLDVIALQEVGRKKLPVLCSALGNGKEVWNYTNFNGCAILSHFPVERVDKQRALRCCWAKVELPGCLLLEVVSVHLDHRRETDRIKELDKLATMLDTAKQDDQDSFQSRRMIWMGDFNALTQSDYTAAGWSQIVDVRARNSWEAPQTDLTRRITEPPRRKLPGLGMTDTYKQAVTRIGPLSTCRFDTRIDYIFLTPGCCPARVLSHEHIEAIPFASDHNLVVATLEFE